jgi:DNA helicase II / ATP-dependent DNA helicase PcrA
MNKIYKLNPEQNIAMEEISKPVLILAGAGSGKTRVITNKFAYLVNEHNYNPGNILAVTFTNKAATEMKERAFALLGMEPDERHYNHRLWISTFHSACGRILRREIDKLGYTTNFTIYDTNDSERLIKDIYKSQNLDDKNYPATLKYISRWKNDFISPKEAQERADSGNSRMEGLYAIIYEIYEKKMTENNALDFDDMIIKTIKVLSDYPEVGEYYKNYFKYIMVDEFQDTNKSQYLLIKLLASDSNISVVGDDDQSIYSWRGADISNIIDKFPKDFSNCRLVKLEQNYRSTNTILNAANSVIAKNMHRLPKKLWSNLGEGEKILFRSLSRDKEEANYVVREIEFLRRKHPEETMAVFYRMNYQSRSFEEMLRKMKIPYKIFGGIKFYERKEIKDLLAYMRLISNTSDSISLKRIINLPKRSIGNKTIGKIEDLANKYNLSFFEAMEYGTEQNLFGKTTLKKINSFLDVIKDFNQVKAEESISYLFHYIVRALEYKEYLEKESKDESEYKDRLANIEELGRSIIIYEKDEEEPTLENYLMEVNLQTDIDDLDEKAGYVSLMTIHKSKGLEFHNVFVTGCEEGILPHYNRDNFGDKLRLEEERRLFYVAMTRAKKRLFLTSAESRYTYGRVQNSRISSFIKEINPVYMTLPLSKDKYVNTTNNNRGWERDYNKKKDEVKKWIKKTENQSNEVITNVKEISINDILFHPKFGKVVVQNIKNNGVIDSIIVRDSENKIRNLILKYAKLSKEPY